MWVRLEQIYICCCVIILIILRVNTVQPVERLVS